MEGRCILKTSTLCLGSAFVGHKLAGNLVDHVITNTFSDSLNSWYIKKVTGGYIIYAILGSQFLLWKEGLSYTVNYGTHNELTLSQVGSLPTSPDVQYKFQIVGSQNDGFIFTNLQSQHRVVAVKGNLKGSPDCTRQSVPFLSSVTGCGEYPEGSNTVNYCFLEKLFIQKLN